MDKRAAAQYLDRLFGTRQGHVAVAYKDRSEEIKWIQEQFAWPARRSQLLEWAESHTSDNVFICPALRKDAHARKKGDMQPTRWLWADVDLQGVPPEKRADVEARIAELGTLIIGSGTDGNRHVYVELNAPVDHADFIKLNTGLRDYLYADNKQADNSLLRLPGTTNWKTESGAQVTVAGGNGKKSTKANLLKRRAFRDAKVIVDAEATDWDFIEVEGLPRRVKAMVSMDTAQAEARYGSRYKAVWAITGDLHKRGMSADEIHSLMDKFPPALSKAADENGYDVHRDVDKRLAYDRAKAPVIEDMEADEDAGDMFEEMSAEEVMAALVDEGVQKELLRRAIRRQADVTEAMRGHTEPPPDTTKRLSDALKTPPAPVQWLIDDLCSATATVVITGQFKTGKTKLMLASLVSALVDNEPFLGSKAVHVPEGGAVVGHWNLEMSELDIFDKYMRPVGYKNPHNVIVANWRGYRLNILTEPGKQAAVQWLKSHGVMVWTIDSWTALCRMCGVDPNAGTEVGMLLGAIEEIKEQAEVNVCFFLAHTAKSSSESDRPATRGASEVDDHVDTRWMLTVDKSDIRFIQAQGRDTMMTTTSLEFDEATGRSKLGSTGRASAASDAWTQVVMEIVEKSGEQGISENSLWVKMKEAKPIGKLAAVEHMVEAVDAGLILRKKQSTARGGRAAWMHYPTSSKAPEDDRRKNATPGMVDLRNVGGQRRTRRQNA